MCVIIIINVCFYLWNTCNNFCYFFTTCLNWFLQELSVYQHENVVALLDVKVGTGRNTHTGTVNAAFFCSFQPGVVWTWTKSAMQCTDEKGGKRRRTKKEQSTDMYKNWKMMLEVKNAQLQVDVEPSSAYYLYCQYPLTVTLRIKLIQLIWRQQLEPFVLLHPAKREPVGSRWIWNFAQSAVFPLVHLL